MQDDELLRQIDDILQRHPRLRTERQNVRVAIEDGVVVLRGAVDDIAAKRLVPRLAVRAAGGTGVRDSLLLRRSRNDDADQTDDTILDRTLAQTLLRNLESEPVFEGYLLSAQGTDATDRETRRIDVGVEGGVARLSGCVGSLSHRRLAEVLAWWTPGCRDVDNRLAVSPPQMDDDYEITDALRLVLEKDPWIDASHIGIRTRQRIVTLTGTLPGEEQKRMAENDAWYIPGVHEVNNDIRTLDWQKLQDCADEASRDSFPASDAPSMTPVVGVGGHPRQSS